MKFSDLEVVVAQVSRGQGYVRNNVARIWVPGGGDEQQGYSRELAGALLTEADIFFDRALMLYFLRTRLRDMQASTWAGIASYYSNYFAALSFVRLSLCSVTHVSIKQLFEVTFLNGAIPQFSIRHRKRRLGHADIWEQYYNAIQEMAWPDSNTASVLSPSVAALRFREQEYRERINYKPGEGFEEIYLAPSRYSNQMKTLFRDTGVGQAQLSDAIYTDVMAGERLKHVAALLRRIGEQRPDQAIEATSWSARKVIVERYAATRSDRKLGESLIPAK
ncbi:MAG TPA: hypothetical protein VNW97_03810 [Candidatus Saccharimonadales bacterium]|nr:hypothetical protein [Candidatus Saccharimonadales bacterium]